MPDLTLSHANHAGIIFTEVGDELRAAVEIEAGEDGVGVPNGGNTGDVLKKVSGTDHDTAWAPEAAAIENAVSGGAGFVNVNGAVTHNLATGRAFHNTMTGSITSLTIENIPDENLHSTRWTWVLAINGTGNYAFTNPPTVTWVDGADWSSLDLRPNAMNQVEFWTVGTTVMAALVTNGRIALDPYKVPFLADATVPIPTETESIDLPAFTRPAGNGTITFNKNGGATINPLVLTEFALGDVLNVICTGSSTPTAVRIPRYLT